MLKHLSAVLVCAIALSPAPIAAQEADLTLDQIVQKHVAAEGGDSKMKAVKTMKATGTASLMGGQIEAPVTMYMRRPNSMRMEMTVQGKSFVQAFDGTTAWIINPFMGSSDPQKSNDEDTESMKEDSDFVEGPLAGYKEKGYTAELLGKEDVDGSPAYKIKLTKKSGKVSYAYIDAQTFLLMRTDAKRKQMGQELDLETDLGNYKSVEGVMVPFSLEQKNAGKSMMHLNLNKIEMNAPAGDSLFAMPEKSKDQPSKDKSPDKP